MLNTTNITPPRVEFLDKRTGLISREWYRFLLNLYQIREDIGNTDNNLLGDALIGFKQANADGFLANAVARNVSLKLEEYVSVLDFGAVPDGVTDSTQAFQNAYDVAPINGTIHVPSGDYIVSSVSGTKNVLWLADGINTAGWSLDLPGILFSLFQNRILTQKTRTTSTDYATSEVQRICNYSGGTAGFVNSAGRFYTKASSNVTNFEWALIGQIDNYATAGENVGVYGQGLKHATGPTWGGVFEGTDLTNASVSGSSGGLLGLEVDIWCNGTDGVDSINSTTTVQTIGARRIGIDVTAGNAQWIRNGTNGIGRGEAFAGIRVGGSTNATTGGAYYNGLAIMTALSAGIYNYAVSTWGIRQSGNYIVGIDLAESVNATSAIRIKANDNIALEATSAVKLKYNSSTGYIEFYNGSTRRGYIDITAGSDTNFNNNGGTGVLLTGNQTVAGIKTFTSVIPANAGITLPSATVNLGTVWSISSGLTNFGGTNAQAWIGSATNDIDALCTDGFISGFLGATYNQLLIEYSIRPLYCIVSSLVKNLQNKKVL